ncbi:MAG: BLUF domain-containing protein [Pseudomonadota bacterium]
MSLADSGPAPAPVDRTRAPTTHGAVSSLLYVSRAVRVIERPELAALVDAAQRRNRACDVTGVLYHENGKFLQWLEGPEDAVDRLFRTIMADDRHTDIQVVTRERAAHRLFSDWSMRLYDKSQGAPIFDLIDDGGAVRPARDVLERSATALLAGDDRDVLALFARAGLGLEANIALCDRLARALRRQWDADACTDPDVTGALSGLLVAFRKWRRLRLAAAPRPRPDLPPRSALIATLPGEPHFISAPLACERLLSAGVTPHLAFPETNEALFDDAHGRGFDGAAIVTSPVFGRAHWSDRLRAAASVIQRATDDDCVIVSLGARGLGIGMCTDDCGFTAHCLSANELPAHFA